MSNAKKAFDRIIEDPYSNAYGFGAELFNQKDIQRLTKLVNLKKYKNIESPPRQVKDFNKNTILFKNI